MVDFIRWLLWSYYFKGRIYKKIVNKKSHHVFIQSKNVKKSQSVLENFLTEVSQGGAKKNIVQKFLQNRNFLIID